MMPTHNSRRPGLSLTEVLVALFVMALGIISLMTLFPLGAVQMGQALRDDRSGQTASQADGITRLWWQTLVVEQPGAEDEIFTAMDTPDPAVAPTLVKKLPPYDNNPSYPAFLDPMGWQARTGVPRPAVGPRDWITGVPGSLPRRSARPLLTAGVPDFQRTVRACSMMDDITFKEDGTPDTLSGSTGGVVREGAYNWCAVLQRPNNANRYVADFKVLVFHTKGLYGGHAPGSAPAGSETIYSGAALANANQGSTQIGLNVPIANLPLRSGSWILDGSDVLDNTSPLKPVIGKVANFYRIQSITELSATSTILELDTPLKSNITQLYILRGLIDVFDRPQLTDSGYRRQAP